MALVSIIVPVYNVEKYLKKCMDSLINQSLNDIEIICVNDGSTDSSRLILEEYHSLDKRVIIVDKENEGLSSARNEGMRYATGEYLMFVDSDDWIDLDTCNMAFITAKKYNADLVFWSYVREFPYKSKERFLFSEDEIVFDEKLVKMNLQKRLCGLSGLELRHPEDANTLETAWGKLYRTEKILNNKVEFIDTKKIGTEDALFNIYAFEYIQKAVYIKKCFYHYRKDNDKSLTSQFKFNLFDQWQKLFDLIYDYIIDRKLSEEFINALQNRIALSIIGLGLNIVSSQAPTSNKIKWINQILNDKRYSKAFDELDLHHMPLHWKIFFWCARMKFSWAIYFLLNSIQKIRK